MADTPDLRRRGPRRRGFLVTDAGGNPTVSPFGDSADVVHGDGTIGPVPVAPPPGGPQAAFLLSGGQVIWESGYTFRVSAAVYYINGSQYTSAEQTVTLNAPDASLDRIDVIVLDTSGDADFVEGTPNATPSEPSIDPATQLKIALVLVSTGTTEPVGLGNEIVYADNAGSPAEWNWTSTHATIVVDSTTNPHLGTKDIEGTNVVVGAAAVATIGAGTIDPNTYDFLAFFLRPKATWANGRGILVSLRSGGVLVGAALQIRRTGSFGFVSSTLSYQQIAIPITSFAVPAGTVIDGVRLEGFGGVIGWYADTMAFQRDATTPTTGGITQAEADARYAPLGPGFITVAAEAGLPSERRLTAGAGVSLVDGGAGSTMTVAVTPGVGVGDVVGPAAATDNAIARYDGTTGKLIQDSAPIVQDDGRISTVTDPSSAQDAATKNYVDSLAVNLGKRATVRAATTANITIATALNNGDTLDGVTLVTGDWVLVKDQAAPEENGVYEVGVSPARASQFDAYDEHPGSLIAAQEGTANADTLWLCTSNAGGTIDVTALAFTQLSVSAGITELTGHGTAGPGSGSQALTLSVAMRTRQITIVIGGSGSAITTGAKKLYLHCNITGTITGVRLLADVSGSIAIDIWKDTYANFPPTILDTIVAAAKPTLSGAQKSEDATLTGWTVAVTAGDVFEVSVDSATTVTKVTMTLTVVLT